MRALLSHGSEFSLYQAVELIERMAVGAVNVPEQAPGEGRSGDAPASAVGRAGAYLAPSRERVRFRATDNLGFPVADIARITRETPPQPEAGRTPGERYVIETACLGLYGPDSPLPDYVNEQVVALDRDTGVLRDFLDLFNHRLVVLLCRIARRYRHQRVFDFTATDELSLLCGAWVGEPDPTDTSPDPARAHRLRNAHRLGRFGRSAHTLERVLADRFEGIGVRIEEFVACTVFIRDEQRQRLGLRGNRLGHTALLGDRTTARDGKVRVWIGPLGRDQMDAFLPDGAQRHILDALLERLLPAPLAWDLRLCARPDAAPPTRLARTGALGASAWLGAATATTTVDFTGAP